MIALAQDFGVALRALRRRPGVFCTGVVVIGIALGGGAALLLIADAALLRPPAHVREPGAVVRVQVGGRDAGDGPAWLSFPVYEIIRDRVASLAGVAAYGERSIVIGRDEGAREVAAALVTASYFPVLGVRPAAGRFFHGGEDDARPASAMVISYGLWQSAFGGSADALGGSVQVGNDYFSVVGVAPRGFTGVEKARVDVWLPITAAEELIGQSAMSSPTLYWVRIFGRAAAARSVVGAEVAAVSAAVDWGPGGDVRLTVGSVLAAQGPGGAQSPEGRLLIWAALSALMVFAMACANVATVLLARFVASASDWGTRAALGASRARLILAPQLRPWRVGTGVFAGFGIVAVMLVGVGLHGLLAFIVARSRRVIGIRVALGATPAMVWRSIVLRGTGIGVIGTAVGLVAGVLAAPVGRSFLFGVEARDPLVFLGSAVVVAVAAMTAGWLPARQASRVDAAALLRED